MTARAAAVEADRRSSPSLPLPPGPRGLPLVGNAPALRRDQLGFLTRVQRRFGDAATIDFGRAGRFFLFSAPEAIERILVSNATNYTSREVNQPSMPFLGDGLLNIDGEVHRRQRALVQPAFARRRVESYADVMVSYTESLLAAWRDGQVVDMREAMQRLTLEIVARALFGMDLRSGSRAFGEAFTSIIEYDDRGPFGLPRLHLNLPFTAYGRYVRARTFLDQGVYGLIAERRRDGADRGDIVSTLLAARDGEGAGGLSDKLVRDHAMTLLAAGHETTSNALTFTLHLLSRNPEKREKLLGELHRELGGRPPAVEDLPRLVYLDLVLKESLRLYPPAWIIGRRAVADDVLSGYRLPAGEFALASQWVVHRRPDLWPDPERFLPERWLPPEEGGQRVAPYAYFPFGAGPRTCIGMPFALQEAKLILATLLQRFVPELLPGQRLVLEPRVTLRPKRGTLMRLRRVP